VVTGEVGIGRGLAADPPDELAGGRKPVQDAHELVIQHVDVAALVDDELKRAQELAVPASAASELAPETPLRGEHLDTRVATVRHVEHPVRPERDRTTDRLGDPRVG
jgi:hypothetical protein